MDEVISGINKDIENIDKLIDYCNGIVASLERNRTLAELYKAKAMLLKYILVLKRGNFS